MAYEGGSGNTFKNLWSPDLTTRAGALNAAQTASLALYIVGFGRLFLLWLTVGFDNLVALIGQANPILLIAVAEIALMLIAATMLRSGRGAILAVIAAALYAIGMLVSGTIFSWIVGIIMFAAMVGGVRGAWALSRGRGFSDDVIDTFA
ncbi:hypothetical protein [Sphingopyxis sp. KK2]|uniref:hypothetical protein n=1 Tax=Sphingopyxis sp. KK2 TaxID=1855727 RepID=UPI00097E7075|nr:hypothetical protein [Sphingopyxis sp. KK2]